MDLKNLGKQTPHQLQGADARLLEAVHNPCLDLDATTEIVIVGDEFTSLCPATGGPDFGIITISYCPLEWIIESKSLKYYLESYRQEPIFHERCAAKICSDLGNLLQPRWLSVQGDFKARGGWAIKALSAWKKKVVPVA